MTPQREAAGVRSGLTWRFVLLFLAQALAVGATAGSQAMSSIIAAQLGKEWAAGLPSTVNTFAAAVSAYPFGFLMSRLGRRFGLVSAYVLGAVGAVTGFAGARAGVFPLFLLGCAILGAAQGGYQQGRYAAAESVSPSWRAAAMSALLFASVLGSALATLLAPALDRAAPQLAVSSEVLGWLIAAAFLVGSALLTMAWRSTASVMTPDADAPPPRARAVLKLPVVRAATVALCATQAVMVTLMVLTPLRAHHLGYEHTAVAGFLTLHFAGMFGLAWLVGPLVDRVGVRFALVAATVVLLVSAVLLPLTSPVMLGAGLFLLGLGWNLGYVGGSALLAPHRAAQGAVDAFTYLSAGVAALTGSLVTAHAGFGTLAVMSAVVALLPGFAGLVMLPRAGSRLARGD